MNMRERIMDLLAKYEHTVHSSMHGTHRTQQLFIDDFYHELDFSAPSAPLLV
jgi:hypothetical protein